MSVSYCLMPPPSNEGALGPCVARCMIGFYSTFLLPQLAMPHWQLLLLFMPHKVFQSQCELALLVGSERSKKEEKFDAYRHCRVCVWASAYRSNPRCGEGISFFAISPRLLNLVLTYIFHLAIASPNTFRTVKNLHDLRLSEEIALK